MRHPLAAHSEKSQNFNPGWGTSWIKILGFVGRAFCNRQAVEKEPWQSVAAWLAQGDLAILYQLAEFLVDFLSVVMSWCRSFAVCGGGEPQIPNRRFEASLPPLVPLAPDYFSLAK